MKTQYVIAFSALALAAASAFADQRPTSDAPLTHAEVRQSIIAARKAGQLTPTGDAADYAPPITTHSTISRSEVRHEVLEARAAGSLVPAGEGEGEDDAALRSQPGTYSTVTRADVNAATLQARVDGELLPAGSFDSGSLLREQAQSAYAQHAWLARHAQPVIANAK